MTNIAVFKIHLPISEWMVCDRYSRHQCEDCGVQKAGWHARHLQPTRPGVQRRPGAVRGQCEGQQEVYSGYEEGPTCSGGGEGRWRHRRGYGQQWRGVGDVRLVRARGGEEGGGVCPEWTEADWQVQPPLPGLPLRVAVGTSGALAGQTSLQLYFMIAASTEIRLNTMRPSRERYVAITYTQQKAAEKLPYSAKCLPALQNLFRFSSS